MGRVIIAFSLFALVACGAGEPSDTTNGDAAGTADVSAGIAAEKGAAGSSAAPAAPAAVESGSTASSRCLSLVGIRSFGDCFL